MTFTTLDSLFTAIKDGSQSLNDELPSFGGTEPTDTTEVWSWDEERVIVGACVLELELMTRSEWLEWSAVLFSSPAYRNGPPTS